MSPLKKYICIHIHSAFLISTNVNSSQPNFFFTFSNRELVALEIFQLERNFIIAVKMLQYTFLPSV